MCHVHLRFVRLHIGDELLEILGREILAREDQHRRSRDQPDRLEIVRRVIGEIRVECDGCRVGPHVAGHDGVAVRIGALGAGRPRSAAGAGRFSITSCWPSVFDM